MSHYVNAVQTQKKYMIDRLAQLRRELLTADEIGAMYINSEIANIEAMLPLFN